MSVLACSTALTMVFATPKRWEAPLGKTSSPAIKALMTNVAIALIR
jgi:glutamate racemase